MQEAGEQWSYNTARSCRPEPGKTEVERNTAESRSERLIYTPPLLMDAENVSSSCSTGTLDGRSEHGGIEQGWNHTYLTEYTALVSSTAVGSEGWRVS